MYYKTELNLENFEAWSGGADRLKLIKEQYLIDEVEQYITDIYHGETPTETEINDTLWFDDYINDLIDWS